MRVNSEERSTGMGATRYTAVLKEDKFVAVSNMPGSVCRGRLNGVYRYYVDVPDNAIWASFYRSNRGNEHVTVCTGQEFDSFSDAREWAIKENLKRVLNSTFKMIEMFDNPHNEYFTKFATTKFGERSKIHYITKEKALELVQAVLKLTDIDVIAKTFGDIFGYEVHLVDNDECIGTDKKLIQCEPLSDGCNFILTYEDEWRKSYIQEEV